MLSAGPESALIAAGQDVRTQQAIPSQENPTMSLIKLTLGCVGALVALALLTMLGSIAEGPEY